MYIPALLREAKRWSVDVLLLQELNIGADKADKYKRDAERVGYHAYFSCSPTPAHRGGTAVLVRAERSALAAREPRPLIDDAHGDTCEGRVCGVEVWVEGAWRKFVSMYVPAHQPERAAFVASLNKYGDTLRDAVVQGDMNCVARPRVDEHRENGRTAPAEEGPKLEEVFSAAGLKDVHITVNGEEARDYTRYSKTVKRRLDRFYAAEYNAFWRWSKVRAEPNFFRGASAKKSDHLAVVAEMDWVGARAPTATERRIKPEVLQDNAVRTKVRILIEAAYAEFPPEVHGHAKAWTLMKESVTDILMHASKKETPDDLALARRERDFIYSVAARAPPSGRMMSRLAEADEKVAQLEAARKKDISWWSYISTMADELGSKWFFRKFKARNASPDIAALWKSEDWGDEPKRDGGIATTNEEVADEARKYYKWLFEPKNSKKADRLLKLLEAQQLPQRAAKAMEKDITAEEISEAIFKMAPGKSPGPDKLPAEFYQQFAPELIPRLTAVVKEGLDNGALHADMRKGEIILLYKKGDAREIRNYRPITLLNVDYKIFSKVVTQRLKAAVQHIVSKAQLGFVPGRLIQEGTHLLKLLQAALDETDEEGIIVAADWEKAFDRVSWSYLHKATKALGFGPKMRNVLQTMYTEDAPPLRQVRVNGVRSDTFEIHSGVPQGCPTSPLVFLLVAEALTRAVETDDKIRGIQIAGKTYAITQFADDTQFMLRGYKSLMRMWEILKEYEDATGMKANAKKFEGLRCGSLKRKPVPTEPRLRADTIKWAKPGEYVRILGIPYWEGDEYDPREFWIERYEKMKRILAAWRGINSLTLVGRRMIANAMVAGRFRYYAQTLACPNDIVRAIGEDMQAIIWGKGQMFHKDDFGTELQGRRAMREGSQYLPQAEMGGGVIHWEGHVKALAGHWIMRYADATSGPWKDLLDLWLNREREGRGIVFTTLKTSEITKSLTYRAGALPKFWTVAIEAIRELGVSPKDAADTTADDAKAHPMWFSKEVKLAVHPLDKYFREDLELRTVRDIIHPAEKRPYSADEIMPWVEAKYSKEGEHFKVRRGVWVHEEQFMRRWEKYVQAIPPHLLWLAADKAIPRHRHQQAIMRRWGWKPGRGLGKREDGRIEPVNIDAHQHDKKGLGAGSKKKQRKKPKEPHDPILGVVRGEREIYGKRTGLGLKVFELNIKGVPRATDEIIHVTEDELRQPLWWRGGIVGIAECMFPHPERWRLADIDKPLDRIGVRDMTRAFARRAAVEPSCKRKWTEKLGEMNWQAVAKRYKMGLVTPTDFGTHYKCIAHRQWRVWGEGGRKRCRLCGHEKESVEHLGECPKLRRIYESLRPMDEGGEWDNTRLNLLGVKSKGVVKRGVSAIHHFTWKHVIPELVRVETEDAEFQTKAVLKRAAKRYKKREAALQVTINMHINKVQAREGRPIGEGDLERFNKTLDGIAEVSESGKITRKMELEQWLQDWDPETTPN